MADAVWPPDLPQAPRLTDLEETPPSLALRTEMEVGPAKLRRRGVAGYTTWPMSILIPRNQRGLFLDFFRLTLKEGSLSFDWRNPATGGPASFRFVGVPKLRPLAQRITGAEPWLVSFTLEELPSISNAVIVPPGQPEMPIFLLVQDSDEGKVFTDEFGEMATGVYAGTTTGGMPPGHSTPMTGEVPISSGGGPDFETDPDLGGGDPHPLG